MRHMVNGRIVEVRTAANGSVNSEDIRRVAGIPRDRRLVLQLPNGQNKIINPGENLSIAPDQFFSDIPEFRSG